MHLCLCWLDDLIPLLLVIPGAAQLGRRPTGIAHSKITHVRVLSWLLPGLTSLYFLTVTKSCHMVTKSCYMKCDESLSFRCRGSSK